MEGGIESLAELEAKVAQNYVAVGLWQITEREELFN